MDGSLANDVDEEDQEHEGSQEDSKVALENTGIESTDVVPSSQDSGSGRVAYWADRRSTAPRPSQDGSAETLGGGRSRRQLRKSASSVRLSMGADGNAKIVTEEDESSISLPQIQAFEPPASSAPATLHVDSDRLAQSDTPRDKPVQASRRKPSGRSRDSRAWEFWCDRDARTELEEKANQEASGSAADAIGLIRSSSGRGVLGSLSAKRQSLSRQGSAVKRVKTGRVPLLQRSHSVQNKRPASFYSESDDTFAAPRKFKKTASGLGIQMPMTDSDKENWSPERQSTVDLAEVEVDDEDVAESPAETANIFSSTKFTQKSLGLSDSSEDDEETTTPTERERKSQSVSEEEELDCVQGLLSLSQGNWR